MHIISASRRTDIPHYYAAWFKARRAAGVAHYRTVYGGGKEGYFKPSLKPEDVIGYLFWTKFVSKEFHVELEALRKEKVPYVFQYTITGYGKDIQPGIPSANIAIEDFLKVEASLPGPESIQWRYDPILLSTKTYTHDWHRNNFAKIAASLEGHTRVVNVSFTEPYKKVIAKVPEGHTITWRQSAKQREAIFKQYPELIPAGGQELELLRDLEAIAKKHGMQLRTCCNSEYSKIFKVAQCCGAELFAPYGDILHLQVTGLPAGPSRETCQCLKTVDIGMDSSCPGGCFYCYVTTSFERAIKNFESHNPNSEHMR